MDKLNMEDYYFHGLAGNISFWNTEEIIKVSLWQLSSIVNTGGIYSRQILKNKFNMEYPYKGYFIKPAFLTTHKTLYEHQIKNISVEIFQNLILN